MAKVFAGLGVVCLAFAGVACVGCGKTRPTALDVDLKDQPAAAAPAPAIAPAIAPARPFQAPSAATHPAIVLPPATAPAILTVATTSPATQPHNATQPAPAAARAATHPTTLPAIAATTAPVTQPATPATAQVSRDRKIIAAVDAAIEEFRRRMEQGNAEAAVDPLITLADRVRSIAVLRIPVAMICSKVDGFGIYDPIEPRLRAGRETSVVLYCELTGFHSRQGDRAMWETRVAQEIVLLDANSQELWKDSAPAIVDQCRNLRRDFYVARILRFPATIAAGQYTLRITMTDQLSHESVETTFPIQFVSE